MQYNFKNLVFEGGGVKGIAYIGALQELEKQGILQNVERVAGTSAGAITALLVALNFTAEEIKEEMLALDFNKFADNDFGVIRDTWRLFTKFGWNKGDYIEEWTKRILRKKGLDENTTFTGLSNNGFKRLKITSTCLTDNGITEDITIVKAIRRTTSIPFFFIPVKKNSNYYVDGGLTNNYPINIFGDLAGKTLGFYLKSSVNDNKVVKINNLFSYIKAVIKILINQQELQHVKSDDWKRTCYIDTLDIKTTDFDITQENKLKLIEQGRIGINKYLEWYNENKVVH